MNETPVMQQPVALAWGPAAIIGAAIVLGFLILSAYAAWEHGAGYEVPARDFIALLVVVGFFGIATYTFFGKFTESGDIILGALIAAFSAVVALYFRSRNGEKS